MLHKGSIVTAHRLSATTLFYKVKLHVSLQVILEQSLCECLLAVTISNYNKNVQLLQYMFFKYNYVVQNNSIYNSNQSSQNHFPQHQQYHSVSRLL